MEREDLKEIPPEIKKIIEDQIEAYPLTPKEKEAWSEDLRKFAEYGYKLALMAPESTATVLPDWKEERKMELWRIADRLIDKHWPDWEITIGSSKNYLRVRAAIMEALDIITPQAPKEVRECYEVVEIKSADDLPKENGHYLAGEGENLSDYRFKDGKWDYYHIDEWIEAEFVKKWLKKVSLSLPIKEIEGMGQKDGNSI